MIIAKSEDLHLAMKLVTNSYELVLDFETTGLAVRKDKVIGFGICNVQTLEACYVVLKKWNPETQQLDIAIPKEHVLPLLQKLKTKKLHGWNFSYDSRIAYHYFGIELWPSLYMDGQLALHTLEEDRFNYQMKPSAAEFLGADATDEQADMKQSIEDNGGGKKEFYKADWQKMAAYGLKDVVINAKMNNLFRDRLKRENLWKFFIEEEVMPLYVTTTIPMELKGIKLDMPKLESAYAELVEDLGKVEDSIQSQIAPLLNEFNDWYIKKEYAFKLTGESKQVLAELIAPEGWPKTKNGTFSFAKVDYERAVKKGLVAPGSDLERYAISLLEHVPLTLQRQVSLELLRRQGTKYTFNLSSKDHLKRLFFTKLNEKPLSTTPKGAPQVDDSFLELMASKHPWAAELQDYNKLIKIKGTYYERFLEENDNGMFYPQFFQHRTSSGRYSGDMQQLPRKKSEEEIPNSIVRKYNNIIRDLIISGDGYKLVDADFSSLEVVVFADDAGDEALLQIIRDDLDFYSMIAIKTWNLTEYSADKSAPNFLKKHKPELRQAAKSFALGIRYGLGAYKLSKDLNIPQEEAEKIVKGYLASFPQLAQRMEQLTTQAKTEGFVKSKAGRVLHVGELQKLVAEHGEVLFNGLELWKKFNNSASYYSYMKLCARKASNMVNSSLNHPIQSLAASIVSRASIALSRAFKAEGMESYIALSIHDELVVRAPDNEVEKAAEMLQHHMENTTKLSVPLQAEPQIGTVYGEIK